jgi:hypothetical protein
MEEKCRNETLTIRTKRAKYVFMCYEQDGKTYAPISPGYMAKCRLEGILEYKLEGKRLDPPPIFERTSDWQGQLVL